MNSTTSKSPTNHAVADDLAPRWRRFLAFVVDYLILGLALALGVICVAGTPLYESLIALQDQARWIGFTFFTGYFALMDGPATESRSPGKRLLGIAVKDAQGRPLAATRAGCRAAIVAVPLSLNGIWIHIDPTSNLSERLLAAGALTGFLGLGVAILYTFFGNWGTRQALHDMAVGAVVTRAEPHGASFDTRIPRTHAAIACTILVVTGIAAVAVVSLSSGPSPNSNWMHPQREASRALAARDDVVNATVSYRRASNERGYLAINALVADGERFDRQSLRSMALDAIRNISPKQAQPVAISLYWGWNMGIIQFWRHASYTFPASELRPMLSRTAS